MSERIGSRRVGSRRVGSRRVGSKWVGSKWVGSGLTGLVDGGLVDELPFLILGAFFVGFDAGAFKSAGDAGDASRSGGSCGGRLIGAEERVVDGAQGYVARRVD